MSARESLCRSMSNPRPVNESGSARPNDMALVKVNTPKNHQPDVASNHIWLAVAAVKPSTMITAR